MTPEQRIAAMIIQAENEHWELVKLKEKYKVLDEQIGALLRDISVMLTEWNRVHNGDTDETQEKD